RRVEDDHAAAPGFSQVGAISRTGRSTTGHCVFTFGSLTTLTISDTGAPLPSTSAAPWRLWQAKLGASGDRLPPLTPIGRAMRSPSCTRVIRMHSLSGAATWPCKRVLLVTARQRRRSLDSASQLDRPGSSII